MLALGPNYRLTDIQAALGISQLERLDAFVTKRQELAKDYQTLLASDQRLQNFDIQVQATPSYCQSSFHLFVVQVPQNQRKACFDALRANGFGVNVHYIPIHTQPYYQAQGFQWGDFPRSEAYYKRAISLPIYPHLPQTAPEQVVDTLARALT
jgi:dTDP-4-amino-4,6-dideoxygalactose transaminase